MFKVMNEYMRCMELTVSDAFTKRLEKTLQESKLVASHCVTVNFNRYILDIKLKKYTVENAERAFCELTDQIACSHSEFSLRYNEGTKVRYRYATCMENKKGYYCDIVFGPEL